VTAIERADDLGAHWLAAWMGDAGFEMCCAPDVQYEDPIANEPTQGIAALDEHAQRLRAAFPDLRVERTAAVLADSVYACIPWRIAGTHQETNRFVTLHGLHYLELTDGRIRRARGFFDLYDAATQLGILPARGGIGESVLLLLRGFGLRAG
jgi:hypothetical protein